MNKSLDEILQLGSVKAAPLLLGCILSRQTPEGELALKIVETEAYHQDDPASHSFRGLTLRTAPMFQAGGTIYVYFTYGMHYCVNIVVGKKGRGEAVLLRAGEPVAGIDIMKKHRGLDKKPTTPQNPRLQGASLQSISVRGLTSHMENLANGPAKLTQAVGIVSTELSGKKLDPKTLQLSAPAQPINPKDIVAAPRIGIKEATQKPWRFYIKDNPFASKV